MEKEKDITKKRILIYLGVTFLITYGYEFGLIYPMVFGPDPAPAAMVTMTIGGAMFMPALGVLITRVITKERMQDTWLRPNFKGHARYYVFAWFAMPVLTIAGAALYFLIFPDNFDKSLSFLQTSLAAAGQTVPADELQSKMGFQLVAAFFAAPLLNAVNCFGEEWGWRGYLLPKMMEKFSIGKVLLINGVIWGLWHAPITIIGHNYGMGYAGWPFTGILAMCGFCIMLGVIFSYITIKTGSCLPAILAHGSINGIASVGIYFTKDGGNPFIGPAPTGIIGAVPCIITAVIMAALLIKEKEK